MIDLSTLIYAYGYIGVFIVSLLGSATVIFPIPYLIVIYYIGASRTLNPLIVSILGGLGATIGELVLYFVGLGGRKFLSSKRIKNLELLKRALSKYGPIIIFIFAATPLPDDILYPVLGIMRYNFVKMFLSCFLGKAVLTGIVVLSGYYSYEVISKFIGGGGLLTSIIVIILAIIFTIIVLKIDWSKIFRMGGFDDSNRDWNNGSG